MNNFAGGQFQTKNPALAAKSDADSKARAISPICIAKIDDIAFTKSTSVAAIASMPSMKL